MVVVDCLQNSAEWLQARLGIPTGSMFSKIVTSTGKPTSASVRSGYLHALVAERLTGQTQGEGYLSDAMIRGTMLEPDARRWFSFDSGESVTEVGFCYKDKHKLFGASPDGITTTGGIEIKCMGQKGHIAALLRGQPAAEHATQIQANLWITGRSHWWYVLFSDAPGLPSIYWRVEPDDVLFKAFDEHLPAFCADVDEAAKQVKGMG